MSYKDKYLDETKIHKPDGSPVNVDELIQLIEELHQENKKLRNSSENINKKGETEMHYDEDERVASCQREIQRLRCVIRNYEAVINEVMEEVTQNYEKSRNKKHETNGSTDAFGYSKQMEILNDLKIRIEEK